MSEFQFDAFAVAARLAIALDAAGIRYAIGGAIALGIWAEPRGTYDVDINLFIDHTGLDSALDVLAAAGVAVDRAVAHRADAQGDVIVGRYAGMRIDLFTPSIPFAWEAARTARRVISPLGAMNFLSAEAMAVFKLLFFRPKDLVDLEKLLAVQRADLDSAYIRRWVAEMMGEDDERVAAWDAMVRRQPT